MTSCDKAQAEGRGISRGDFSVFCSAVKVICLVAICDISNTKYSNHKKDLQIDVKDTLKCFENCHTEVLKHKTRPKNSHVSPCHKMLGESFLI